MLMDKSANLIGRFCQECWNGMAGHEQVPVVSIAEAQAKQADLRDQVARDLDRRRQYEASLVRQAMVERDARLRAAEKRRQDAAASWALFKERAMAKHPTRHTCPQCKTLSYGMREHDRGCEIQNVPTAADLPSSDSAYQLPQAHAHWSRSGELVINGRYGHHRPRDMSPADVFGDGGDWDEAA
jgi:PIN domain nuclease of toxin-antitoxin system